MRKYRIFLQPIDNYDTEIIIADFCIITNTGDIIFKNKVDNTFNLSTGEYQLETIAVFAKGYWFKILEVKE